MASSAPPTSPELPDPTPADPAHEAAGDACDEIPRSLVFRVGEVGFACDARAVREVVAGPRVTRLPGAPPVILGLVNVRGAVVTVLDGAMLLTPGGGHGAQVGDRPALLVDRGARGVAVVVDRVMDVRVLDGSDEYQWCDLRAAVEQVVTIMEDE